MLLRTDQIQKLFKNYEGKRKYKGYKGVKNNYFN